MESGSRCLLALFACYVMSGDREDNEITRLEDIFNKEETKKMWELGEPVL